jgi:hypothetical protein
MNDRAQNHPRATVKISDRTIATSSCPCISLETAKASLVGSTTIAVQFSSGTRAPVARDSPLAESRNTW